jgi:parvulin-like peptidyl-prolyl isomerase
MPEIAKAILDIEAGAISTPIETKLGYHLIRVEKWFASELTETVREEILGSLFQNWLSTR